MWMGGGFKLLHGFFTGFRGGYLLAMAGGVYHHDITNMLSALFGL